MKVKSKLVQQLRGSLKPGQHAEKITAESTYGKRMRIGRSTAPVDRHSPNQDTWRIKFSGCKDKWNNLTEEQKAPYILLGKELKLTGYQVYISQCLLELVATEVIQSDKTLLHATVHFDATDNTIKGTVTANRGITSYAAVHKIGSYTTAQTDAILWDPTAGKKFVINDIIISTDTQMDIHLEDGTTKIFSFHFGDDGGCSTNLQSPYKSTTINNNLTITTSAAGKVDITVLGYEV